MEYKRIDPFEYQKQFANPLTKDDIADIEMAELDHDPAEDLNHYSEIFADYMLEQTEQGARHREAALAGINAAVIELSSREPQAATIKRMTDAGLPQKTAATIVSKAKAKAKTSDLAYYDSNKKEILVRTSEGVWNAYNETQFKRILKSKGFSASVKKFEQLSDVDRMIVETQDKRSLSYSGQLAGWPEGVHETRDAGRILVTKGATLIKPQAGNWDNLRVFMESLFSDHPEQLPTFYGWMKIATESLYTRSFRPGQCFVMAGSRGNGKSLLQLLMTEMLGARFARPYQYLAGKTEFNSDLFTAEHLAIEDDVPSSKLSDRRSFGAKIKEITANQGQRLHAKGRDAIILPVFWRITVSVNDEPENLMILPPIDESLKDKLILTHTKVAKVPCDTTFNDGREKCWQILSGELPAFLHWLQSYQIPEQYLSGRYGVKEFHHPTLMDTIQQLSPEAKMEQLVNLALFSEPLKTAWTGSATELEQVLTSHQHTGYEARKLLSFNTACGVYLARLANKYPEQYHYERHQSGREWKILPPNDRGDGQIDDFSPFE